MKTAANLLIVPLLVLSGASAAFAQGGVASATVTPTASTPPLVSSPPPLPVPQQPALPSQVNVNVPGASVSTGPNGTAVNAGGVQVNMPPVVGAPSVPAPRSDAGPPKMNDIMNAEATMNQNATLSQNIANNRTPDTAANLIRKMENLNNKLSLEDVNASREAIARLDVMIDIQKRLNDFNELKNGEGSGINPISAAALLPKNVVPNFTPPPISTPAIAPAPVVFTPPAPSYSQAVVERVSGANGSYIANIRVGEGKAMPAHEGDKLSDGSVVRAISNRGVTLLRGKKEVFVAIQNVNPRLIGR